MKKILHSDANAFYASVECALDPSLKGKAVAVCGSVENRHGIVLAKSELAKKYGIKTGMTNWQAKRLCPDLIVVPPRHEEYARFSHALHEIYLRYTDRVEPFGLDECWLDVTNCFQSPLEIANELRAIVKSELGITVSVGVSFTKVFAKLGSDMKKPDAVTEITQENFRNTVWKLPCSDLLFCGKATTEKLKNAGIKTVGDLANCPVELLTRLLGKNGETLKRYACGEEDGEVARYDEVRQAKSIGHGITCVADLDTAEEVNGVIVALSQDIGVKLRKSGLQARGISLSVRDNTLAVRSWQQQLPYATQCSSTIVKACTTLFAEKYDWAAPVRAVTVSAINLERTDIPQQVSFFEEGESEKRRKVEAALDQIRGKFGRGAIKPAVLLCDNKLPEDMRDTVAITQKTISQEGEDDKI